jgi:hypothetical protein
MHYGDHILAFPGDDNEFLKREQVERALKGALNHP